ncbi:threonylcarbamoyl-AMP synthase [Candidatus Woesearchaeota archaeon]|nr:threonylcarbamoyl-AMP synthase [Candidatus Woesearchaeota archaeon]
MQVITRAEARLRRGEIRERILKGDVFIHPTDTIYGLGCNALDSKAVKKLREMKKRPETPFSVIAPSRAWIEENCEITPEAKEWLDKLPGPYTFILKTKDSPVAKEVAPGKDSLGVRMPEHWITPFIEWIGVPIITTSVNITDEPYMTQIEDLDQDINDTIKRKLSFVLYEGPIKGRPSKLVHLERDEIKIRER